MQVFTQIFRVLDSDHDNQISANAINIAALPAETVKALKPIFEELDDMQEGINEIEFVEAAGRLYEILDPASRTQLIATFKSKLVFEQEQYSFSPKLNKTAKCILRQRLDRRSEYTKAKIEQERIKKQAKELEECTF